MMADRRITGLSQCTSGACQNSTRIQNSACRKIFASYLMVMVIVNEDFAEFFVVWEAASDTNHIASLRCHTDSLEKHACF